MFAPSLTERIEAPLLVTEPPIADAKVSVVSAAGAPIAHITAESIFGVDPAFGTDLEGLPCQVLDPDLWFAETPGELEQAKGFCAQCPVRSGCLAGALNRREPWGVWGGEIFSHGVVVARKRPRGRPRKDREDEAA